MQEEYGHEGTANVVAFELFVSFVFPALLSRRQAERHQPPMYDISTLRCFAVSSVRISE